MTPSPVVVAPAASIGDALALMRRGRFRHLPVVDEDRLAGVLSERDLHLPEGIADPALFRQRAVHTVMTPSVLTVAPSDPVEEAARLMLENKVGCLPVLEGDRLAGIVTEADIFRAFVRLLGVMEAGTRLLIETADLGAALGQIAAVCRTLDVQVIDLYTDPGEGVRRRLTIRFNTVLLAPLLRALRAAGLDVRQPDRAEPAST